jgi:hypothetical protein
MEGNRKFPDSGSPNISSETFGGTALVRTANWCEGSNHIQQRNVSVKEEKISRENGL